MMIIVCFGSSPKIGCFCGIPNADRVELEITSVRNTSKSPFLSISLPSFWCTPPFFQRFPRMTLTLQPFQTPGSAVAGKGLTLSDLFIFFLCHSDTILIFSSSERLMSGSILHCMFMHVCLFVSFVDVKKFPLP